jgi:hypothetical protein
MVAWFDKLGGERLQREEWWSCSLLEERRKLSPSCSVINCHIDGDVVEDNGFVWRFTGFYGEPRSDKKELSWKALRTLNAARRHLWLCRGDFNEILMSHEKEGGVPKPQICMDRFREA